MNNSTMKLLSSSGSLFIYTNRYSLESFKSLTSYFNKYDYVTKLQAMVE